MVMIKHLVPLVQSEVSGNMIFQLNLSGNAFIDTLRVLKNIFRSFLGNFNQVHIEEYHCNSIPFQS